MAVVGTGGTSAVPEPFFPADACTLPTAERPGRLAEFDGLFAALRGLGREAPDRLLLRFEDTPSVEAAARDLTAREASCCTFFDFAVQRRDGDLVVDVRVPAGREPVLDGLVARAEAVRAARG